jgi:dTDP-L-rhamnose 4-epimerase
MSINKILITGGAGFIGSALSLKLLEKGYYIRVLDNLVEQVHGQEPEKSYTYNLIKDKTEFIKGDVTDRNAWISAIEGIDCIIHLAAETGTGQSMYEIHRYVGVNCGGTSAMLDVLANVDHNVSKIVLASSRAVYGEGKYFCVEHGNVYPDARNDADMAVGDFNCKCPICHETCIPLPTDETSAIKPSSVYAVTKYSQEQLLLVSSRALGITPLIFRFQNVYGPGQSLKNPYTGVLSVFATLMKKNQNINIFEDGNESRDFVFIDDIVNSIIKGIECNNPEENLYNVGSGTSVTILEMARLLRSILGSDSELKISGNFRAGDIRNNFADINLIARDLNYKPDFSLSTGLHRFLRWADDHKEGEINYNGSLEELKRRHLLK